MKPLTLILLCSALLAQEPKPKTPPANYTEDNRSAVKLPPPAIPADHAAEYFAAESAFNAIAPQYQKAQADLQTASAKVIADCGPVGAPNKGVAGKMVCEPRPEASKSMPAPASGAPPVSSFPTTPPTTSAPPVPSKVK